MNMNLDVKIVSVIINFNGLKDTCECIDSLLKSTIIPDIIVVDNASVNNEGEIIRQRYPSVQVIISEINLGFTGGNNIGIRYALKNHADFILLLNNDTIVDRLMIDKLIKASNCKMVCAPAMYYYTRPDVLWYGGGKIDKKTGNVKHYVEKREREIICNFATGCCMLVSSKVFEYVGVLDEKYFMYCEDMEFCIRLSKKNIPVKYVPGAKLWHKTGMSSGGNESAFSIYYLTRNRLNCLKQHADYFPKTAYIYTLFSRIMRMLQFLLKGKCEWKAFYKGIIDHSKGIYGFTSKYM